MRTSALRTSLSLVAVAVIAASRLALAEPPAEGPPAEPAPVPSAEQVESKERFFRGLELFAASEWGAALAEFDRSRQLHPTRAATRNSAICLRNLTRYDEAVALYELWVSSFPDAPADERALVDEELRTLAARVGKLSISVSESGATVFVDGAERGRSPLAAPLVVSAGSRVVQVYKDGYLAAQATVSVPGAASSSVELALRPLAQSGRLRVKELEGRAVDVLVDGIKVGVTPWEGALPPGSHHVELAGAGDLGSQPVAAPVALGDITSVTLPLEKVPATLTVTTSPPGALIALDGVSVGRGSFRGRVRLGAHRVEVGLEGYLPAAQQVSFDDAGSKAVVVTLERDRTSTLWNAAPQPRFALAAMLGPLLGPSLFGESSTSGCEDDCSATPVYGALGMLSLGYRWPLGITVGADLGYLGMFQRVVGRDSVLYERPDALRADLGKADDALALQGLVVGPSIAVDGGETITWRVRLMSGVFVANAADRRVGRFAPATGATPYATDPYGENERALSLVVLPEVHVGVRIAERVELGAGLAPILVIGLDEPAWQNDRDVLAPDFLGYYEPESLVGDVVVALAPTFGVSGLF